MVKLYIQRQIRLGEEVITEAQLLERSKLIVVLAEPGAGKTDLLLHIANMLRTESVRASRFRSAAYLPTRGPIVIDAMDEVAKIGDCALNDIIVKASEHSSGITVLASRSGEWENARTKFVEECFYLKPTIVYLEAFNTAEQKRLFDDRFSGENFEAFASEAASFDLTPLLGNPEFLQILGHAYRENNRHFSGKSQIYSDATKRLAQETNEGHSTRGRPEAALMVRQAGSIFARLTLSGASGISRKENIDDRNYPYVAIVAAEIPSGLDYLLDSKLFKPASDANEHEPVHRIVAEYLAAQYLVGRISDAGDRLSLKRCLAVIAPNNVVRDELRGLLGWMAALGGDAIQKAAVALDPYAVLSNGDPAQLLTANKLLLIERLQQFAKTDPYFRRSDSWRSFNVGQFFSDETVAALRPVLAGRDVSHLRGLILDLIKDTPVVTRLVIDLENLIFDPDAADHERIAASRLLFDLNSYDTTALFDVLLAEASPTSLKILTQLIVKRGTEALVFTKVLSLLRALASLYPKNQRLRRSLGMSRYFLKEFFRTFPSDGIESYLDELTDNIRCICNARHRISCECTRGISKIIGGLLDRYFEARAEPYDPDRIRRWTWNPNFSGYMRAEDSPAVRVLSQNHELRRTVQRSAFARARLVDECNEIASRFWMSCSHSGLLFQAGDAQALIKCAFEENRVELWESLWRAHDFYQNGIPNPLRTMMREQAQQNTEFQKIWAKKDRDSKKWWRVHRSDLSTRSKRYTRREEENKAKNLEHLHKNRKQIEAGQHWGWLRTIAHHYLYEPQKLSEVVDDI